MITLFRPGGSLLHRTPAGAKVAGLLLFSTLLVMFRSPTAIVVAAVVVAVMYAVSGFGPRVLLAQVWPLRWFVLLLVPFQLFTAGWQTTVEVVGTLVVAVVGASLVTLTTRVSEMLAAIGTGLGPLRLVGIDPERVALLLTLTIRAIPVIGQIARDVADGRRARGLERSTKALVSPLVVRTVQHAERVGEALAARGFDD